MTAPPDESRNLKLRPNRTFICSVVFIDIVEYTKKPVNEQIRLKELDLHGITDMDDANRYLAKTYLPAYNAEVMQSALEDGSAFVPWIGGNLDDILCQQDERTVGADNCVSFEGMKLQVPANQYRCHYVRVKVRVHRYANGELAIFHGPRKLADYDQQGKLKELKKAA